MIDPTHPGLSIQQQCELLGVPRSTYYYQPRPESAENLRLLRQLDQLYLKRPFFGSRKMAVELEVNRKRIQRLMRILGIEAHYPKPNLSRPAPGHEVYPYLLRGVAIERPNHVWSTDITYLPMRGGFLYLVAVLLLLDRAEFPASSGGSWCSGTLRRTTGWKGGARSRCI